MQAPSIGLVKAASADSAKFAATGLAAQNSSDFAQAASSVAGTVNGTAGLGAIHSSGVLPMEVDDDAMFKKKQPTVKADPGQVSCHLSSACLPQSGWRRAASAEGCTSPCSYCASQSSLCLAVCVCCMHMSHP